MLARDVKKNDVARAPVQRSCGLVPPRFELARDEKQKEEEAPDAEVITMEEQLEPEVSIDDLPGVGPATAEKLREAGFDELLALAVMSPPDLAEQAELGEAVAGKIIQAAKKMANIGGYVSASA